jgi:hypothetical protein
MFNDHFGASQKYNIHSSRAVKIYGSRTHYSTFIPLFGQTRATPQKFEPGVGIPKDFLKF